MTYEDPTTTKVHATSTEATYPNAVNGPWETRVEEFEWEASAGRGTRYRVRAHNGGYPSQLGMIVETLEEALDQLVEQERRVRESGVSAETPRLGRCSCGTEVPTERLMRWSQRPFSKFEDNYDGCRGWD